MGTQKTSKPIKKRVMRRWYLLFIVCPVLYLSCGGKAHVSPDVQLLSGGESAFEEISHTLETGGSKIDYDSLMQVYDTISASTQEIPHMNRLLVSLMDKRNDDRRIDQMILIFTAKAVGGSRHPIPHVDDLLKRLLSKDDRLSEWVLAFVAEAIENYAVDLQEGDKIMDLVEDKLAMVRSSSGPPKEYFGSHFLPPPKGDYIRSYIAGIQEQSMREKERRHYYYLIASGYSEAQIETALKQLHADRMSATRAHSMGGLAYLFMNRQNLPDLLLSH